MRDQIVVPWFETAKRVRAEDRKRVYYLSMEFLIGRLLQDAAINLGLDAHARAAMAELGVDFDAVVGDEPDAALGKRWPRTAGGLLPSIPCRPSASPPSGTASATITAFSGRASRTAGRPRRPRTGSPRAMSGNFARSEANINIGFGGEVERGAGGDVARWRPAETVIAAAYDTPVPGWRGKWVNTLRLWAAKPTREFELEAFNRGDFFGAAAPAVLAQTISRVLYPNDSTPQGKELRLKQEYFFTAASLRDILRRFDSQHTDIRMLPHKIALQLNDTHPAIAGPELIRLLTDERGLSFDEAFDIGRGCLKLYQPHADARSARALAHRPDAPRPAAPSRDHRPDRRAARPRLASPPAVPRSEKISVFGQDEVRMGQLAFIAAHRVNGVSALHTELMKETVFDELHALHPDRVVNQTQRRHPAALALQLQPGAAHPVVATRSETAGSRTSKSSSGSRRMPTMPRSASASWRPSAPTRSASRTGSAATPASRSTPRRCSTRRSSASMNTSASSSTCSRPWRCGTRCAARLKRDWTPRVKIFGGKAAPGYHIAKLIIKLINDVGKAINADQETKGRLRIVFPPNYNVSMAERLIPAADLSEQISTAGMEASGTGNMKFALNGALTVGTLDGANVEIAEKVGRDNIFIFGLTAPEVVERRRELSPGRLHRRLAAPDGGDRPDLVRFLLARRAGPLPAPSSTRSATATGSWSAPTSMRTTRRSARSTRRG